MLLWPAGCPAPRPVEPERALQGEPADPDHCILRVERVEHYAVALGLRLADRDLIRVPLLNRGNLQPLRAEALVH